MRILFWSWPRIESPSINFKASSNAQGNQYFYFEDFADRLKTNSGNLVHWDATNKIFDHEGSTSCYFQPHQMTSNDWDNFISIVNENFDAVVVSQANSLRPDADHGGLASFIERVKVKTYLFGLGLQDDFKADLESVKPGTKRFLEAASSEAQLFTVRGERTANWLSDAGIKDVHVTGCPSMYVYPHKILEAYKGYGKVADSLDKGSRLKYLSAGHFERTRFGDENKRPRAEDLDNLFKGDDASYVFQSEFRGYYHLKGKELYDPVTKEINYDVISSYLADYYDYKTNFNKFLFFTDADTWRLTASHYDLYIGDRLHAGLVSLQSGTPSILLHDDVRVKEIASYFNLPNFAMSDIKDKRSSELCREILRDYSIAEAIDTYKRRYSHFKALVEENGLKLQPYYKKFESQVGLL